MGGFKFKTNSKIVKTTILLAVYTIIFLIGAFSQSNYSLFPQKLIIVEASFYEVEAYWDNDAWLENERKEISDWESLLELECFVATYSEPLVVRSRENFNEQCENRAFQMRKKAIAWGRYLDTEYLTPEETRKYLGFRNTAHAINKAVIKNDNWWYFVDYDTKKIWKAIPLD